jgi:hypothetical protein
VNAYDAAVLAWAAELRAGRTTRWSDFWPGAPVGAVADPVAGPVPGAAQLELVRRLAEHWHGPGFERLADKVLVREGPGRGLARTLPLVHPAAPSGPGAPPIDPSAVPIEELIRIGIGVLADLAESRREQEPRARRGWRRRPVVVGAPLSGAVLRTPGLGHRDVVVCAPSPEDLLTEVWAARALRGGGLPWRRFVRTSARHDELPLSADPARLAARAAERVGPGRVHVFVGSAAKPGPVPGLSPESVDLLRRLNPVLGVRLPDERRDEARRSAVRMLAGGQVRPLAAPLAEEPWLRARATRAAEDLAAGGYAVHGDLDAFVAGVGGPRGLRVSSVLERLLEVVARTAGEEHG